MQIDPKIKNPVLCLFLLIGKQSINSRKHELCAMFPMSAAPVASQLSLAMKGFHWLSPTKNTGDWLSRNPTLFSVMASSVSIFKNKKSFLTLVFQFNQVFNFTNNNVFIWCFNPKEAPVPYTNVYIVPPSSPYLPVPQRYTHESGHMWNMTSQVWSMLDAETAYNIG